MCKSVIIGESKLGRGEYYYRCESIEFSRFDWGEQEYFEYSVTDGQTKFHHNFT